MRFFGLLGVFLLLLAIVVSAQLVVLDGNSASYSCDEFTMLEKTFVAGAERIRVGVLCSRDSRIEVGKCIGGECGVQKEVFKQAGDLPLLGGFEIGGRYSYTCYACEGSCAVEYKEGERVDLRRNFGELDFSVIESEAPLSLIGMWRTDFESSGEYMTRVALFGEHANDTAEFCVKVHDVNQGAYFMGLPSQIRVREGETLDFTEYCVDKEKGGVAVEVVEWDGNFMHQFGYDESGSHDLKVGCYDEMGVGETREVMVVVEDVNRAPFLQVFWRK